ncbi:MAG: hypothetical protein HY901_21990, partial [Deltaproteobacteria bacterium]|nr:hypothetical protein [Deltaproteobacteria bacterium]
DYARMKSARGVNVYEYDALLYTYLGFNLASPKFADRRVRQALAYATDKKQLVNLYILTGDTKAASQVLSEISKGAGDDQGDFHGTGNEARR